MRLLPRPSERTLTRRGNSWNRDGNSVRLPARCQCPARFGVAHTCPPSYGAPVVCRQLHGGVDGWTTCPLTQLGFVRLSMQPAVVKIPIHFGDAMAALGQMTSHGAHRFWPLEGGLADINEEIRARLVGHHQLTDSVLLDLAIRHRGRLATFDRRVLGLLPVNSVLRDALAIIPA